MQAFTQHGFGELIDLLAAHTARYSELLVNGNRGEEFEYNKRMIKLLQAEIGLRKQPADQQATLEEH